MDMAHAETWERRSTVYCSSAASCSVRERQFSGSWVCWRWSRSSWCALLRRGVQPVQSGGVNCTGGRAQ